MYVVHNRFGKIMTQSAWKRLWESYLAALNLKYGYTDEEKAEENITSVHNPEGLEMRIEPFTGHQLRHTFCTLMYLAGVDILTARDQMGHKDIETTLQIYTHLDKMYKRKSMGKLDEYLCQSSVSQKPNKVSVVRLRRRNG